MKQAITAPSESIASELWTMTQVCNYIGLNYATVVRMVNEGKLPAPASFGGRCRRFVKSDVIEAVKKLFEGNDSYNKFKQQTKEV